MFTIVCSSGYYRRWRELLSHDISLWPGLKGGEGCNDGGTRETQLHPKGR